MYQFNAIEAKNACVKWIRDFFETSGQGCIATLGLSGGKDSTVAAALCVEALGKDRVLGVLMPNGYQSDIADSYRVAGHLDIKVVKVNIEDMYTSFIDSINYGIKSAKVYAKADGDYAAKEFFNSVSETSQMTTNLPPRIRMTTLYAIAQMLPMGGRVVNTCNLSETILSWETRWGDNVGDFSPLRNFTATEVVQIGFSMNLPRDLVEKIPADGLTGKSDEEAMGIPYSVCDTYLRTGVISDMEVLKKIEERARNFAFKRRPIPAFDPQLPCMIED